MTQRAEGGLDLCQPGDCSVLPARLDEPATHYHVVEPVAELSRLEHDLELDIIHEAEQAELPPDYDHN